jgi:hypothetical protein
MSDFHIKIGSFTACEMPDRGLSLLLGRCSHPTEEGALKAAAAQRKFWKNVEVVPGPCPNYKPKL